MLVSKIVNNRVLVDLQRKKTTSLLKQSFTTAVTKHVGIQISDYTPHQLDRGKRLEKWQYESRKLEDIQVKNINVLKRLEQQIKKYQIALENSDITQLRRQRNRINKSISELDTSAINPKLQEKIDNMMRR